MYILYLKRVINSTHCWIQAGEYATLEQAANALHSLYWLEAHCVKDGRKFTLNEHDCVDADGNECVEFSFS